MRHIDECSGENETAVKSHIAVIAINAVQMMGNLVVLTN